MLLSKQSSKVGASAIALSSFEGTRKCELNNGGVAQLGEHLPCKQGVIGSSPIISTIET